jgi:hypothetical protein
MGQIGKAPPPISENQGGPFAKIGCGSIDQTSR